MSAPVKVAIHAEELRVGDMCSGSGFIVEAIPAKTARQVVLAGRYPNGELVQRVWNARTTLNVLRVPDAFDEQLAADRARTDADPFARVRR